MRRLLLPLALLLCPLTAPASASPTGGDNVSTPNEVFAEMRKSFQATKAKGLHIRWEFHFSNPQAGNWWVEVTDGQCAMGPGEISHPDVTFTCTGSDWVELSNGTLSGFRAYLTGRLHVQGSQALARKLDELFP